MDRQIRQVKDFADKTYFQYVAEATRSKEVDDAKLQKAENDLAASIQEVSVAKKMMRDASGHHATEQRRLSYELSAAQVHLQRLSSELSASDAQKKALETQLLNSASELRKRQDLLKDADAIKKELDLQNRKVTDQYLKITNLERSVLNEKGIVTSLRLQIASVPSSSSGPSISQPTKAGAIFTQPEWEENMEGVRAKLVQYKVHVQEK